MKLFYREMGKGEALVILHGLYGSSDNWMSIGRELAQSYRVILVDQRNHGRSPHSQNHTYSDLTSDLHELINHMGLSKVILLGHSMGGKVAMLFAALHPKIVKALVVVDVLPVSYKSEESVGFDHQKVHSKILSALLALHPESASSRNELDDSLVKHIPEKMVRQFLLKNLKRNEDNTFKWVINVEALSGSISQMMEPVLPIDEKSPIQAPTLFVKGENSSYIYPKGEEMLQSLFNNFIIEVVPNAGHWLHHENSNHFLNVVTTFLKKNG